MVTAMDRTRSATALDRAAATRIRVLAAERNIRQVTLARAAGIPTSTFNRYWNGDAEFTLGALDRILAAMGTSLDQEWPHIRTLVGS